MKFVSKYSNYRIVLRQGIPAVPVTGTPAISGVYVKFEDGMLDTDLMNVQALPENFGKDEVCKRLLAHPQFNRDFLLMEEAKVDPYALTRRSVEPEHDIINIEHGGVSKSMNPKMLVDRDKQAVLMATAKEMAKSMFKEMMAEFAKDAAKTKAPSDTYTEAEPVEVQIYPENTGMEEAPKKKAGRPPKAS